MQIERKIKITYRWWNNDLDEIDSGHILALEETAQDKIYEMLKEGYTSGELLDNVRMHDTDPEDGIEYRGWWEMTYFIEKKD